jgi:hypothetical protein
MVKTEAFMDEILTEEAYTEQYEKIRQAIMRYRELLDLTKGHLAEAEKTYAALLGHLTPQERAQLPAKEQHGLAAQKAMQDLAPLRQAVWGAYFNLHQMTQAFSELQDNINTNQAS